MHTLPWLRLLPDSLKKIQVTQARPRSCPISQTHLTFRPQFPAMTLGPKDSRIILSFKLFLMIFSISVALLTAIRTFSDEVNLIQLRSADT